MWNEFTEKFYINFIKEDRWLYITDGLKTTLKMCIRDRPVLQWYA